MSLINSYTPTSIIHGPDTVDQLGELVSGWQCSRALVVSDPGIIEVGHTSRGCAALQSAGIETHIFSDVHENPTTDDVKRGTTIANEFQPDVLIGLGGGSSMDCAKGINFLYTNGGEMKDYWGIGKASQPMLPMVAIPTTAGTGSETQSFALISDAETHVKMACGDKKASCKVAILDPTLTTTQPKIVTAVTGIDAIAHALETHVTTKRNKTSLAYSQEAWLRLASNFTNVLGDAPSIESREQMQLGACLAGMAIEHSMLGATHALANPLTAKYGIIHGQAIAIMLPHVIRFNADEVSDQYEQLLQNTASTENMLPSGSVENLAQFVESLVMQSGLSTSLAQCGVEPELLPALAEHAAEQWTGQFNPRKVEKEELLGLYKMAYE